MNTLCKKKQKNNYRASFIRRRFLYLWLETGSSKSKCFGNTAESNRPEITQVIFKSNKSMERDSLEKIFM